jgi:Flp pilus assembly protein TadG
MYIKICLQYVVEIGNAIAKADWAPDKYSRQAKIFYADSQIGKAVCAKSLSGNEDLGRTLDLAAASIYAGIRGSVVRKGWGSRCLQDRRGATAVEFALVAAPLFGLIFAALQVGIIVFFDQALQTVTSQAARMLMVGAAQKQNLTQAQFQSAVCGMAPAAFVCNNLMVDVESFTTFSSANTSPITPTYNSSGVVNNMTYSPGGPGSIVVIRVMYDWPVFGGPFTLGLANQANGTHLLVGTAVIKNEPYQ